MNATQSATCSIVPESRRSLITGRYALSARASQARFICETVSTGQLLSNASCFNALTFRPTICSCVSPFRRSPPKRCR